MIISESLHGDGELLISWASIFKLFLLPKNWPYKCYPTDFRTCILDEEEASRILKYLEKGSIDRCLKTKVEDDKKPCNRHASKEEWLAYRLYSCTGNMKDIPNMEQLPKEIRELFMPYEDVLCDKLPQGRTVKIDLVDIWINEEIEKPQECLSPCPTPAHWREESNKILDVLEKL